MGMDNLSKDERNRLIDTIMASKSCFTRFGLNWIYGWGKHSKKNKFYNTIKAKVETSIEKYITILEPQVQEKYITILLAPKSAMTAIEDAVCYSPTCSGSLARRPTTPAELHAVMAKTCNINI